MGTVYIWHGKGSLRKERVAAGKYGQSIAVETNMETKEFKEGNEDETFWMVCLNRFKYDTERSSRLASWRRLLGSRLLEVSLRQAKL
jgi:hypothetical protein